MKASICFNWVKTIGVLSLLCWGSLSWADSNALAQLDLQDLMKIEMVSSSKFKQELSEVTASAFVISADDIQGSGASSLPELLNMVPGLFVAQSGSNSWAMGIRGFNSVFSNKMLVMIDGRSLFSPLFSGVFWEQLDLFLPDIERIEVIRGVGSTIWGANAVDGIINIITKTTLDDEATQLYVKAGTALKFDAGVRFGRQITEQSFARFYAKSKDIRSNDYLEPQVDDSWSSNAAGGKWEYFAGRDSLTVSADIVDQRSNDTGLNTSHTQVTEIPISSRNQNISVQWQRQMSTDKAFTLASQWQQNSRDSVFYRFDDHSFNFDIDSAMRWGDHQVLIGAGVRRHDIDFQPRIAFEVINGGAQSKTKAMIYSGYLQDEWRLAEDHNLLLGAKFESHRHDHHETSLQFNEDLWLPTLRYRLDISEQSRFWIGLSKTARIPSISEQIMQFPVFTYEPFTEINPTPWRYEVFSSGNPDVVRENEVSLELGFRANLDSSSRIDVVAFRNRYSDIRSFELLAPYCESNGQPVPLCGAEDRLIQLNRFENNGKLRSVGLEVSWQQRLSATLGLAASYSFMDQSIETIPSNAFEESLSTMPKHQLAIQLDWRVSEQLNLRYQHKYISGIDDTNLPFLQAVDGFMDHSNLVDVIATYQWDDATKIQFKIQNLLDENGNQWGPEFPAARASKSARQLSLGVNVKY